MDFGHSSEAFIPDLMPPLKFTLLSRITEFIGELQGSLQQHKALSVWRSLSQSNKATAKEAFEAQKKANFAFYRNLTDAAAKHLAQCPQLQTVNFQGCRNLTDAAAQHLAQCPQLQIVNFQGCPNLTDAAAEHLAQCPTLKTVQFQGRCETRQARQSPA